MTTTLEIIIRGALDADAAAYFAAAGITSPSEKSAYNTFVKVLKAQGIYSLLYAMWPIIGGNATAHAINSVTPGSYSITWVNGPTHGASGVTFNGTTQYGNTNFNPNTVGMSYANASLAGYTNDAGSSAFKTILCAQSATEELLLYSNSTPQMEFESGLFAGRGAPDNVAAATGFFSGSRGGAADRRLYRNGALEINASGAGATPVPNLNLFMGAYNATGSPALYGNHRMCFAMVAQNLTSQQHLDLYTAVQAMQTTLGRQV